MKYIPILLLTLISLSLTAQEKFTISGTIKSASNGEELIGASVYSKSLAIGTTANVYGFYSLTLPAGTYEITYSFIGFESLTKTIDISKSGQYNIELIESANEVGEVVVTGERSDANVTKVEMSVAKMDSKQIKKIPALLGEADVIKSVQLLPGVSTVGEGSTGFNVRGGGIDQNLVLLDEAPVFNSSHLLGFFSVFNPDAVKNVTLIKGGIPSEYGGRLSSILDVRMNEGNSKEFEGTGGVGLIFSRLALQGPIKKDKASFLIAGRRSYADILAKPFLNDDLKDSKFYFYDLTAKVNWQINDKNRLYLSGFFGRDVFGSGFFFDWGNATSTLRWNHIFNEKLFMNLSAYYSNYDYKLGVNIPEEPLDNFDWNSKIINYSVKPDFTYFINNKNTLKFGGQSIYYIFKPADASFTTGGDGSSISLPEKYAIESGIYLQNEQKVGARITLQYGIRLSNFAQLGEGEARFYKDTTAGVRKELDRIETFDDNEVIASYINPEPRFSINYSLDEVSSVKASYNRMAQYLHLISNTVASTPVDIWLPTNNNLKPQLVDQIAVGYFRNLQKNTYETSAEVFYKDFQNQIDYIDNANIFFNENLDADLLTGDGRAYGLELYLKKVKGKFNGFISYTLSRSERKVDGINNNEWYATRFDKTHILNVVGSYDLSEKWSFSANFVLSSGTPTTFPTSRYEVQGAVVPHNSEESRNNVRIPAYHRFDVSATLNLNPDNKKRWDSELVFSVYNLYARKNPFSIYFQQNEYDSRITEAIQFSVIGSVVPAVSYNFNF
jgi:hypothetical protein